MATVARPEYQNSQSGGGIMKLRVGNNPCINNYNLILLKNLYGAEYLSVGFSSQIHPLVATPSSSDSAIVYSELDGEKSYGMMT